MKLSQIIIENKDIDFPESYELHRDLKNRFNNYPSHVQQWVKTQFHKVPYPNRYEASIIDAADYYIDHITDNRFQKILSSYSPAPKNILTFSLEDIKNAQSKFDELHNAPSNRSKKKLFKTNHVTELVNDDVLRILKIEIGNDANGAATILADMARGTKWCVTNKKIGAEYLEDGPLFLVYDKGAHNAKFLCHPASHQFMDEKDNPFYVENDRVFELLHKYIKDIGFIYTGESIELKKFNPESAYLYALTELKGRWREAEPYIKTSAEYAYKYALNVINIKQPSAGPSWPPIRRWASPTQPGRFIEAEEAIKNSEYNVLYAINILKRRWTEAEPFILSGETGDMVEYAQNLFENGRWAEAEPVILESPSLIYLYCKEIGRWDKGEARLLNLDNQRGTAPAKRQIRMYWLRLYAEDVVKGRWPEAEVIFNDNKDDANVKKYYEWANVLW